MEFKGTKNLQADLKHNQVLNDIGVLVIANVNDFDGNGKYDTLLYSKAPEMLEMLKEVYKLQCDGEANDKHVRKRILELIKQATEL